LAALRLVVVGARRSVGAGHSDDNASVEDLDSYWQVSIKKARREAEAKDKGRRLRRPLTSQAIDSHH
jgi:hypothetical protein